MRHLLAQRPFRSCGGLNGLRHVSQRSLLSRTPSSSRGLASVHETDRSACRFKNGAPQLTTSSGTPQPQQDHNTPDERTIKLGKTIRILHERLPTLLQSPLPHEILSPHITLVLFPSTHPHLPTVTGKIPYRAALWTAPVAWGRIPVVGNVRVEILSERMVKLGARSLAEEARHEKLVVKWRTCGKANKNGEMSVSSAVRPMGVAGSTDADGDRETFTGLFIFEFDEEGRIVKHVIEQADEGESYDKTARVISVTDWLLGRALGKKEEPIPGLALGYCSASVDGKRKKD